VSLLRVEWVIYKAKQENRQRRKGKKKDDDFSAAVDQGKEEIYSFPAEQS
jgi:hypothetical protein